MKFDLLGYLIAKIYPEEIVLSCHTLMLLSRCSREESLKLYFCNGRFYISDDLSVRSSARIRKCHKSDRYIL